MDTHIAFTSTPLTAEPRSFSIGPLKIEIHTYSVASGDTSGTATALRLTNVYAAIVTGPAAVATAATTYSGAVATLAFVNPAATRYGHVILIGK